MIPLVMANEEGIAHAANLEALAAPRIVVEKGAIGRVRRSNPLEQGIGEGENPVPWRSAAARCALAESGCLGLQLEVGGKFHLKLNTGS